MNPAMANLVNVEKSKNGFRERKESISFASVSEKRTVLVLDSFS